MLRRKASYMVAQKVLLFWNKHFSNTKAHFNVYLGINTVTLQ